MARKVTNVNHGGTVGIQSNDQHRDTDKDRDGEVTNVNEGGAVGVQGGTVSGNTVVINGEAR